MKILLSVIKGGGQGSRGYTAGLNGFRVIYSYNLTKNLGLELCYDSYKLNSDSVTDDKLTKTDIALTYNF